MRIRSIKPDFWKSEKVAGLPLESQLLFIGLWNLSDDAGRFRAHPNLIQGELFPYRPGADVEAWLRPLVAAGMVLLYEVDGRRYGFVTGFSEHQKIDKRTESRLPAPPRRQSAPPAKSADIAPPPVESSPESHPQHPTEQSASPAYSSAGSAERSAADWKGLEGKGEEQAPERARAREGPISPEASEQKQRAKKPGFSPAVLALHAALLESPLRSGTKKRDRERLLLGDAEGLEPTGLTPEFVRELVELDREKAKVPGALLATWLRRNTWREVLDEQRMKAKERDATRRPDPSADPLEGVYGS